MSPSLHYRIANFLNTHPETLTDFFTKRDSLEVFANIYGMLKPKVREKAVRLASRLIVKVARRIADTGYRSGTLRPMPGFQDGCDLAIGPTLERILEAPRRKMEKNLVTYGRVMEKHAFVLMFDHSYSMKGMKVVLSAITAAAIAHHFKQDFAVVAFSNNVTVLKGIEDNSGPDRLLERLFAVELYGDTNTQLALQCGLEQMARYETKKGLLLTDGAWNRGGNPLGVAPKFDQLSVIGFPPARSEDIEQLAIRGHGHFAFVEKETEISAAILKCLQ